MTNSKIRVTNVWNLLFCPILYIVFAQRLNVVNRGSRRVNSVNWYPSLIPINRDQWCLLDTCYVIDCFNRTMENQRPDSGNALAKDEDEAYRLFSFELVTCKRGGRDTNIHRVVSWCSTVTHDSRWSDKFIWWF